MSFLNNISETQFLKEFWEKKPFVFRNVIDAPTELIDLNDLKEMASDEFYESRMIKKENENWDVKDGPFKEEAYSNHNKDWTLINHNLDLYLPEVKEVVSNLDFLPRWLFDDAMSTYSTKGSSVGAHIDNYNVFILQLSGSRTWKIQLDPKKGFIPELDVKILEEFIEDEEFQLNPGDMIYIPPHVAHHGISNSQSLSLSLGYKSLEDKKLMEQFCMYQFQRFDSEDFHKTQFAGPSVSPTLIDDETTEALRQRLLKNISNPETFKKFLLTQTSAPKKAPEPTEFEWEEFLNFFASNHLFKDEYTRFSSVKISKDCFSYGINGFIFDVSSEQVELLDSLSVLSNQDEITYERFSKVKDVLFELNNLGIVYFESE
jgi:50S ribosomal protein L16 3-hydroxylase